MHETHAKNESLRAVLYPVYKFIKGKNHAWKNAHHGVFRSAFQSAYGPLMKSSNFFLCNRLNCDLSD